MFGYENHKEYYDEATLDSEHLLAKIRIPTMFLNSADDPFAPEESKYILKAYLFVFIGCHVGMSEVER